MYVWSKYQSINCPKPSILQRTVQTKFPRNGLKLHSMFLELVTLNSSTRINQLHMCDIHWNVTCKTSAYHLGHCTVVIMLTIRNSWTILRYVRYVRITSCGGWLISDQCHVRCEELFATKFKIPNTGQAL